ncbi:MAG: IPT/TIG domain-containing protein [Verrucomicrobiota bacterium]
MNYKTTWMKVSIACLLSIEILTGGARVNAAAPLITGISPNSGPVGASVTITGEELANPTEVRFNGATASFNVFGNQISASVPAGATTGPITVVTSGGTGVSSEAFTVTQSLPPVIDSVSPASGSIGTQVIISGANLAGATVVRFNGVDALYSIGFSGSTINATVPSGATSGPLTIVTPGGLGTSSVNFAVTAAPPPVITDFSPDTGQVGDSVTINGLNLSGATSVQFNGASAAFTVFGGSIIATVPVVATSGKVTVTTPTGSASSSGVFTVATTPSPSITGISPASGQVGSSVTISGANLTGATGVKFNGLTATFNLFGNSLIATVPAGATTGPITVITPSGTVSSGNSFNVVSQSEPVITTFTPLSGVQGTSVTIDGYFTNTTAVKFNGATAVFTVSSSSRIIATVPVGASTGFITVITATGTATSRISFFVAPKISGFTPASGAAGTSVTISGTSLTGATAVLFNGVNAVFSNVSEQEIDAIVPAGATTGPIALVTPAGTFPSPGNFTVLPKIESFSPLAGTTGTTVFISGTGLGGATTVQFNGVNASFTTVSPLQLRAIVPAGATTGPIHVGTPNGTAISLTTFFVGTASDLSIDVSTSADEVAPGDKLTYTILVTNQGPEAANNVTLTDSLPAGVDLFFSLSNRGTCVESNHVVKCDFGTLANAESVTVKLIVTVRADTVLTNSASVTGTEFDPDTSNNSMTVVTGAPVGPPAAVELSIRQISNNSLEISWPITTTSFVLERTGSLVPPASWTTVAGTPLVIGGKNVVSVNLTGAMQFYRLRAP